MEAEIDTHTFKAKPSTSVPFLARAAAAEAASLNEIQLKLQGHAHHKQRMPVHSKHSDME